MCALVVLLASAGVAAQAPATPDDLPPAIVLKPLFAQRVQMLDVALLDPGGLLVLDRSEVARYELAEDLSTGQTVPRWRKLESVALPPRVWPRDLRGHLARGSGQYNVQLPGTACTVRLGPLRMTCADARAAWAYGIPNEGLEPGRNYFTTPEGLAAYGGTSLFDWKGALIADRQGRLLQLDENRRPLAELGSGDDVIPVPTVCRGRPGYYLAASHRPDGDVLRAFEVDGGRLVQAAPDFPLPGLFIALSNVDLRAFVITRLPGGDRYDAFQADISCRR
jgi:hypothetical protein